MTMSHLMLFKVLEVNGTIESRLSQVLTLMKSISAIN